MEPFPPTRFKRIITASYRLPFKIIEREGKPLAVQSSGGLVSAMLSLSEFRGGDSLFREILWVGKADSPPEQYQSVVSPDARFKIHPVVIDEETDVNYYGGFCNELLWPLFHYFPSLVVFNEAYFESYVTANRLFAEKIASIAEPGDFIWIHDYQLFMVPQMVRNELSGIGIGFFLHIPFPTFEIFRTMPRRWSEKLLDGILGADLIGFHTFDYCQYFLRTVSRIMGHEIATNAVFMDDHLARVDAYPLGIDYAKFHDPAQYSRAVDEEKSKINATLQDRTLVFSIDRLDYSKGFLYRLAAMEYFLETCRDWLEKIVFNMVVIPSRDTIPRYQEMKREIEATIGRINGKFGTMAWQPIVYQYKSLAFHELVALYDLGAVGLITPIRDGMNLVAKEYVACQTDGNGVLVLSETAGAAEELIDAILVNPADRREIAGALLTALTMPERERRIRISRMQERLKRQTVFAWARDFLADIEEAKNEQEKRKVKIVTASIETEIVEQFSRAGHRVLFIDYDGTLVPFSKVPELATPDKETIELLSRLSRNRKNTVVIISGRNRDFLDAWFAKADIYLIAEHGAFRKAPGGEWQCAIDSDQTWKAAIIPVLQKHGDRCQGSFIEEKFSSLAWHYRNVHLEVARERVTNLIEELRTIVAHDNKLQVMEGDRVIEVKRTGYDKGGAALKFVSGGDFDFILALGDDRTDEDIFRALPPDAVTVKIGLHASLARYNLINQREVSRLLERLAGNET
jgi:trehalose 6-phosphate synthase/phosphatase